MGFFRRTGLLGFYFFKQKVAVFATCPSVAISFELTANSVTHPRSVAAHQSEESVYSLAHKKPNPASSIYVTSPNEVNSTFYISKAGRIWLKYKDKKSEHVAKIWKPVKLDNGTL